MSIGRCFINRAYGRWVLARTSSRGLYRIPKNLRADISISLVQGGTTPLEKETPVTPDGLDAIDADVVLAGVGVDGVAPGRG